MPDFLDNHARDAAPRSWGEVLTALPDEAPPKDSWKRLNRALEARPPRVHAVRRERRMSWLIGVASAAVLALAAWSPMSRWFRGDDTAAQPPAMAMTASGLRGPAAPARDEPDVTVATKEEGNGPNPVSGVSSRDEPLLRKPARKMRGIAKRAEANVPVARLIAHAPRVAQERSVTDSDTGIASSIVATGASTTEALQKLKTQSAQLEALVALARDDRIGNASSELLSSELDAGIAAIDATLSRPGLDDARRQELWQQRVETLQQLAGVEATSRWLAAQGAANDIALVSVD